MTVGDSFYMSMPLSIGKDERNVKRIVKAVILRETPKMYWVSFDWEGRSPGGGGFTRVVSGRCLVAKSDVRLSDVSLREAFDAAHG